MDQSIISKSQLGYGTVQRGANRGQGYMHFPETGEPSEVTPVSINKERTRSAVRESRKMQNRDRVAKYGYGIGHQGLNRTEDTETSRNLISRTPKSQWHHLTHIAISPLGPEGIATSRRLGKMEWVPTTHISSLQKTVSQNRVEELQKHPERGSSYRLPPGEETPTGVRNRGKTILIQGNHRVNADIRNGRMFTPVRVIHDVSHPDTQNRMWDVYSNFKEQQRMAGQKRRIRDFNRDFGGPRGMGGYNPNDRIQHLKKMYGK